MKDGLPHDGRERTEGVGSEGYRSQDDEVEETDTQEPAALAQKPTVQRKPMPQTLALPQVLVTGRTSLRASGSQATS